MLGLNLEQILPIIFTTIVAVFVGYKEWRDRHKRAALGLADNPTSCKDHEDRLRRIETDMGEIKGDIKLIKVKINLPLD